MPRLFYGDFDFEEWLLRPKGRSRSRTVERLLAELATSWVALVEAGDIVWCPLPVDESFVEGLIDAGWPRFSVVSRRESIPPGCEFVPWGWTDEAVDFGRSVAAAVDSPSLAAVRAVNSRQFQFDLERSLGVELPGSAAVSTPDELIGAVDGIERRGQRWIIKTEFSQAGRHQFRSSAGFQPVRDLSTREAHRLKTRATTQSLAHWARRRLVDGARLYVEPWLDCVAEVGMQFDVSREGAVTLVGLAEMLHESRRGYSGSIVMPTSDVLERWAEAVTIASQAAAAVAADGYFGPLGIDAMRYRHPAGRIALRPLQDINARWTMGRLSIGLRRFVPAGAHARWLHRRRMRESASPSCGDTAWSRLILTTPQTLGGRPVERTSVLAIAPHSHA